MRRQRSARPLPLVRAKKGTAEPLDALASRESLIELANIFIIESGFTNERSPISSLARAHTIEGSDHQELER